MTVCVDASMVLKWLAREDDSDKALLWLRAHSGHEFVGPSFLPVEVASVLRQKMCWGEMDAGQCIMALGFLERLDIRYEWDPSLSRRAFELAVDLDLPTIYDAAYLAIAEREQCEMWTADARFVRAASEKHPVVRLL
jgi:predicted nucleic acid-binding protein